MRFGFIGPSYTVQSSAVADEEAINWFAESNESGSPQVAISAYGGQQASGVKSYFGTPGLSVFTAFPAGPVRGQCQINGRAFAVANNQFIEYFTDGTQQVWGAVAIDANPAVLVSNGIQVLIVSGGQAYCFNLTSQAWVANNSYSVGSLILDPNGFFQKATANAWFAKTLYALGTQIVDANGNVQQVTTAGTSAASVPTWNTSGTTADGTVVWTYQAPWDDEAGTSGAAQPNFNQVVGGVTLDGTGTLVWQNIGPRLLNVTAQLAGVPVYCDCSDTYFVVMFQNSNKFQMSQVLDGTTWPGTLVNEVSVFAGNIVSIIFNHRELWIFGAGRAQPYQDTGSLEVFDVISGALLETGSAATFCPARLDNSIFWIGQDERGSLMAWRSNGYTPVRVSTHAVEVWLSRQTNVSSLVSYSYQDRGHLFWVLFVPGSDCSWVFDVGEGLWHKRATWNEANGTYQPHWSWNHVYVFGKHLVGDWNSPNLYQLSYENLTDNGTSIRRLRRSPTVGDEMKWKFHTQLVLDFDTGLGPQPPLTDGDGNPRQPQAMLRWSDNRGKTWSNQHIANCGFAGQFNTRVIFRRLGRSRYRVYELVVTDPIKWTLLDAYLEMAP